MHIWPIISAVLYGMNMFIAIYISISMILRRQDPVKTLSWISVMILLPYIGVILYVAFGQNLRKRNAFRRKKIADLKSKKELADEEADGIKKYPDLFPSGYKQFRKLVCQNLNSSYSLLDLNNDIEFYFRGKEALDAMFEAIEKAEHHIHLQTYILEDDTVGQRFTNLLMEKAKSGVEVRLLIDGMGGLHLKKKFLNKLSESGIEVLVFSPVMFSLLVNFRNHRKILVVDGKVGFLGGVNIADRYYYGTEQGDWYDTQIRIRGESVFSLQAAFLLDRYFVLNKRIGYSKKYYPHIEQLKHAKKEGRVPNFYSQIITSGPDSDWASIMQCYFTAMTTATKHIYIISPYFTPNESILNAIKVAALGEIDVRVMLPEKSDSITSHYCTRSYISELLDAGVKVYLFKEGFNHSKVISVDGKMCIVGSANMDIRSFEHNFEVMSVIYSNECTKIVEEKFLADIKECTMLSKSMWKKRFWGDKLKEAFFRLLSPLL
ncbi:MAG: cardiolipin synthase [Candidatus Egerieousia sp.]